jgi:gluconolactonase
VYVPAQYGPDTTALVMIFPDGDLFAGRLNAPAGVPRFRLEWSEQDRWGTVDSVAMDSLGTLDAPSNLGIALSDSGGRNQESLNTPEWGTVASVAFGGPDRDWLYTAQNHKLFRRKIRRSGVAAWTPVKPPPIGY